MVKGKEGEGAGGWEEKGMDGKGREAKGESAEGKGEGWLDLDICPGAPEFLVTPLIVGGMCGGLGA